MTPLPDAPAAASLVDCSYAALALDADGPSAASRLPTGYDLRSESPAIANVNLDFYSCGAIVVDNQTVLQGVAVAFSLVQVDVEAAVDAQGATHGYVLEAFTDSDALASVLSGWGMPVGKAVIVDQQTTLSGDRTVTVDQTVWYTARDAGGAGPATAEMHRRLHHVGDGGARWIDLQVHWEFQAINRVAQVQAKAGELAALSLGSQGLLLGTSGQGPLVGTWAAGSP
ncbi:MAG: hypothetical protein ACYC2H_08400 [Thermoplasmatota archaeon]